MTRKRKGSKAGKTITARRNIAENFFRSIPNEFNSVEAFFRNISNEVLLQMKHRA